MLTESTQDEIYEELGKRIKAAREKEGINQDVVAKYLDLSRVSISNIEAGKQRVQLHTLLDIVRILRIDLNELLESLSHLLVNVVSEARTKRIHDSLSTPSTARDVTEEDTNRVNDFISFIKSKDA
ncbi:helix-turn-helix domain-containing protein [Flavitalea flava]